MASVLTPPGTFGREFFLCVSFSSLPFVSQTSYPDLLRRLWWYSLWLRYRRHFRDPNHAELVVHFRKTGPINWNVLHHLFPTIPRRFHLVRRNVLRCFVRSPRRGFTRQAMVCRPCRRHFLRWCLHASRFNCDSSLRCRSCFRRLGCRNGLHADPHVPIRVFSKMDPVSFPSFRLSRHVHCPIHLRAPSKTEVPSFPAINGLSPLVS